MKFTATGRVLPERSNAWFSSPLEWRNPSGATYKISCDASQLTVVVDDEAILDNVSGFLIARQFAQTVVSALGFSLGFGYTIELIQIISETGEATVFGIEAPGCSFDDSSVVFAAALDTSRKNVFFRMALRDYCFAIAEPMDCASNCYRAIEAIKTAFGPGTDLQCWSRMHEALGTDRGSIDTAVKHFASPVRHGNWAEYPPTTSAQRGAMLKITREILAKYLKYYESTT